MFGIFSCSWRFKVLPSISRLCLPPKSGLFAVRKVFWKTNGDKPLWFLQWNYLKEISCGRGTMWTSLSCPASGLHCTALQGCYGWRPTTYPKAETPSSGRNEKRFSEVLCFKIETMSNKLFFSWNHSGEHQLNGWWGAMGQVLLCWVFFVCWMLLLWPGNISMLFNCKWWCKRH